MPLQRTTEYNRAAYFNASTIFMIIAFVLFLIATLIAAGTVHSADTWFLPAGLASMALAFLL